MPEIDDGNGWERWRCLVEVAHMLSEGIPLEQLMNTTTNYQEEKPTKSDTNNNSSIQDSLHGFLKKGQRSSAGPRKEKSSADDDDHHKGVELLDHHDTTTSTSTTTNLLKKKSNLKIIIKTSTSTVIRTQERSISKKIAIKKHTHHDAPETSTARENSRFLGKRRMDCENRAKKKRAIIAKSPTSPRRNLPQEFKDRIRAIGGCPDNDVLVIQNILFKTDVSSGHSRLSVPYSQVEHQFLNSSEVEDLEIPKAKIRATLVQPCLEECKISLRNWKTNNHYALVETWNEVCIRNKLREGMKIQLWSFRRNLKLCFTLVSIVD